jgi:hypothetical protein
LKIGDVHGEAEDVGVGHHAGVAPAFGARQILAPGLEAGMTARRGRSTSKGIHARRINW